MIQKILSIYENEKKKKKRYKSILPIPCQQKNEFNEDDDWFDRPYRSLNYTHALIKEKLNFLFLKSTSSDTLKSKILIIRVKEVIS